MYFFFSCISGICALLAFIADIIARANYAQWPRGDEGLYSCLEPKKPTLPAQPEKPKEVKNIVFKSRQQWWQEYLDYQRKAKGITSEPQPQHDPRTPVFYEDCDDESMDYEEYYEEEMRREEEALKEKRMQEEQEEEERIAKLEEKEWQENEFKRQIEELENQYPIYDFSNVRPGEDLEAVELEARIFEDFHWYD